jgi:hypothetical protein
MMNPTSIQLIAATLFALAVIHTFSTKYFEHIAHTHPRHAGLWHLLGEVEVVFGFWAMVLILFVFAISGQHEAINYLESRDFTEPMFVFVIMVIAGTRPILDFAATVVQRVAHLLPVNTGVAMYFLLLAFVPLLGSFITEPAAMTLAALMLRDTLFSKEISTRLKYATVGVLFVNISIGGTLTSFAAPPVLMVAAKWQWDTWFMMTTFGWKSALAVAVNALTVTWLFRHELGHVDQKDAAATKIPLPVVLIHLMFLMLVVLFAHHSVAFMGIFLFFLGFTTAYHQYQNPLILREALLVAFFLAGLVVLGGQQQWWLQPLLMDMDDHAVYFGATFLTAITDNAALTYLGSLVEGLSEEFKVALVAGAVTGGGLTVIANAPNPAGFAILKHKFDEQSIHPLGLLIAALPPTLVAIIAFRVL